MGNNRDKHATAEDIEKAIQARLTRARVNCRLWACVLDVAHKQRGNKISKRFQTALKERVSAAVGEMQPERGHWVVGYENGHWGVKISIYHSLPGAALPLPAYNDAFTVQIGNQGPWGAGQQTTVDPEYIRNANPWASVEHGTVNHCTRAIRNRVAAAWADKIKALDEAKKALLTEAEEYRLAYLLDV
jgi:hypothetical protein